MKAYKLKLPLKLFEPLVRRISKNGDNISFIPESFPVELSVSFLNQFKNGDIILLNTNGTINTLFSVHSHHNALFVTGRCNCNCLMCSQPSKSHDDIAFWEKINKQILELAPKETKYLGITGGEPTILGPKLYTLLEILTFDFPETHIDILTNGRAFAWINNIERLAALKNDKIICAIPLHSDYYANHDYIAQSKNAFFQTVAGIHNLARYGLRIEIRIVLHKQSVTRLKPLALFIYKNMPFVEHIAFMGLEYIGNTPANDSLLWIDPIEYMATLSDAIEFLTINGMNVSLYNLQLCLLPRQLWKYSKASISDWKRIYLPECMNCLMKSDCGGLFFSSKKKRSNNIRPFK